MSGLVPGLQVISSYQRRWLLKDVIAGVVLTTLLVPQGMAYAELAGLPPPPSATKPAPSGPRPIHPPAASPMAASPPIASRPQDRQPPVATRPTFPQHHPSARVSRIRSAPGPRHQQAPGHTAG